MSRALQGIIIGLAISMTTSLHAQQNGLYRWTDANGTVEYSDRPPEGIKSEFIKYSGSTHKSSSTATSTDTPTEQTNAPQKMEILPEKDPELCKQAQQNLKALESARIRITEPDGSKRLLSEDEKEEQRDNARQFIKINC
ncbi:MAG: DUF4124 domain-containing protein [Spongiibacteraceae bacterium]